MELTLNYMMQILGKYLQQDASAEEKLMQVEAWYNAALRHMPNLDDGEEKEQEKRTKKEIDKEALLTEKPSESLKARETSNTNPGLLKFKYLRPEDVRRKVDKGFLDYIEEKWLLPKYRGLMTQMPIPLNGAQYLSWLTRYSRDMIDQKLQALEKHPTHYGKDSVPGTINDWIKRDADKMSVTQQAQQLERFRAQKPVILDLINQHLKQKQNGKQTALDFGADPEDTTPEPVD